MVFERFGSTNRGPVDSNSWPLLLLGIVVGLAPAGGLVGGPTSQPEGPPAAAAPKTQPTPPGDDAVPAPLAASGERRNASPGKPAPQAAPPAAKPATPPANPPANSPPPKPVQPPAAQKSAGEAASAAPVQPSAQPQPPAAAGQPPGTMATATQPTTIEPAADGTVSVVVTPPSEPAPAKKPAAPARLQPPPPPTAYDAAVSTPPTDAATVLEAASQPLEPPAAAGSNSGPTSESLYSRPLPLLEALQRSGDRSRRLWITQAYWKVAADFGQLRFAAEAVGRLDLIAPGRDPRDRGLLDVAIAAARADLADVRAGLVADQQQLVDLVRLPIGGPLPWPVDRPLIGPYETHFAAIFSTRPATGRVRAIDRMLPSRHQAVEARAAAVLAADDAVASAEADHARGGRPIESVLAAHQMLRRQQRQFLETLAAYNLEIAEYAMAVADVTVPDEQFVSMLIESPAPWTRQPPATVVPANNLQPISPQIPQSQ